MKRVLIALAIVVPIGLALAWLAWFSPWVSVQTVEVTISPGTELAGPLSADDVRASAQIATGTPLLRVPTAEVEERIAALPQVQSVTVTRGWPDTIAIDVTRRTPVALVASTSGYDVVDADGVVLRTVPGPEAGAPVVRATQAGLTAAVSVARELPVWLRDKVEGIEATTRNDVTLLLRNGSTVMWGSADESAFKAEVLQTLLQVKAARYDVSAPGVPATSDNPADPVPAPMTTSAP